MPGQLCLSRCGQAQVYLKHRITVILIFLYVPERIHIAIVLEGYTMVEASYVQPL